MTDDVYDAHVHLFPDAAAGHAWLRGAGIAEPRRDGTWRLYQTLMAEQSLAGATVLLHARAQTLLPPDERLVDHPDVLDRIRRYNEWGLSTFGPTPGLAIAIGVDPSLMSRARLCEEIAFGAQSGAAAVKFAPASALAYLDEPGCLEVFEQATRHGLPDVVQSGNAGRSGDRGFPYGRPSYLDVALSSIPGLRVVLAHFGEGYDDEVVHLSQRHAGVFADLSMRLTRETRPHELIHLIRSFGPDRVMFGSNYPIANPVRAAGALRELSIDRSLLAATWMRLFGGSDA